MMTCTPGPGQRLGQEARQQRLLLQHFEDRPQLLALGELGLAEQLGQALERHGRKGLLLRLLQQAHGGAGEDPRTGSVSVFTTRRTWPAVLSASFSRELVAQARQVFAGEWSRSTRCTTWRTPPDCISRVTRTLVVFERHQLDAPHAGVGRGGGVATAALLQRPGEQRRRQMRGVGARGGQVIELLAQGAPLGGGQVALLVHQQLDEVAIAAIGRHAASRGVRLIDQAGFFERGHLVAHRGGRELSLVFARDQIRRDGLGQARRIPGRRGEGCVRGGGSARSQVGGGLVSTLRAGVLIGGRMIPHAAAPARSAGGILPRMSATERSRGAGWWSPAWARLRRSAIDVAVDLGRAGPWSLGRRAGQACATPADLDVRIAGEVKDFDPTAVHGPQGSAAHGPLPSSGHRRGAGSDARRRRSDVRAEDAERDRRHRRQRHRRHRHDRRRGDRAAHARSGSGQPVRRCR